MTLTLFAMPSGACHALSPADECALKAPHGGGPACDQELGGLRQPASKHIGDLRRSATFSTRNISPDLAPAF